MLNCYQALIKDLADQLKDRGLRVFIAEKGTHGFYTDQKGKSIVSFQANNLADIQFSGNYKTDRPQETGTGWQISPPLEYQEMLKLSMPHWAIGNSKARKTTLEEHLKTYGESSKYSEYQG